MSYMQDFLFEPSRARAPITALSGGEMGRLMLAKLFLKPSNLIVLDEPSNDLDIETLELLESLLADYKGTVILISHDRQLLENVVTRSLVYQGNGKFIDVAGGYEDFERERLQSSTLKPVFESSNQLQSSAPQPAAKASVQAPNTASKSAAKQKKLSYAETKELEQLPNDISKMELAIANIHSRMNNPDFYADKSAADRQISEAGKLQENLEQLYARWEMLEDKQNS